MDWTWLNRSAISSFVKDGPPSDSSSMRTKEYRNEKFWAVGARQNGLILALSSFWPSSM